MAKLILLYNLKDEESEEEFEKWVHEYKGPLISGLSAVKRYTLTRVGGAMKSEGGPPGPVESPYRFAAVVDITSFEDYAKDQQTPAYKDEFMPQFLRKVKDFTILRADEIWDK